MGTGSTKTVVVVSVEVVVDVWDTVDVDVDDVDVDDVDVEELLLVEVVEVPDTASGRLYRDNGKNGKYYIIIGYILGIIL